MRDDLSGVEVWVQSNEQFTKYHEWRAPLSSRYHSSRGRRTFIEAVSDEPFEVHTTVNTNFDWAAAKHLRISYRIDGRTVRKISISKEDLRSSKHGFVPAHDVCRRCNLVVDGALQRCSSVFHSSKLGSRLCIRSLDYVLTTL
jgi:hypothetical protein